MVSTGDQQHRRRRKGYLVHFDGRGSRFSFRSAIRLVRRLAWPRLGSTLLALVVATTLTLVCQGHFVDDHISAPHLDFLGAPDHSGAHHVHNESVAGTSLLDEGGFADFGFDDPAGLLAFDAYSPVVEGLQLIPSTPTGFPADAASSGGPFGAHLVSAISSAASANAGLATISFLLALSLIWSSVYLRPHESATATRRKSQTDSRPEPPPPRFSLA